jgi:arylsulfatase A-like enzyme
MNASLCASDRVGGHPVTLGLLWIRSLRVPLMTGLALASCVSRPEPVATPLVDHFADATVENAVPAKEGPPRIEWHFDADSAGVAVDASSPTRGWKAVHDIRGLAIHDGSLVGEAGKSPILVAPGLDTPDPNDSFHGLELKLRISKGTRLGVNFIADEKLDEKRLVHDAGQRSFSAFNLDLRPGDELQTYTVTADQASFNTSWGLPGIHYVALRFIGAEGARFEIASMRLVTLKEHLAAIPSGVGWHGLSNVFRETLVTRSPERVVFPVDLPSRPWLDLAIGTVDNGPVTFHIEVDAGGGVRRELQKRTVSTPNRWESVPVELEPFARRHVRLILSVEAEREGTPGFWGSPVVRNRGGRPHAGEPSPARTAVVGRKPPPQGVILIVADTLRRDHLSLWGYDRKDAPVLSGLAHEGALFKDNISQGAWTKVSVSSIITSLYPTTNGINDMPDRIPVGVTTLAEAYRAAGYATFATSSVPFTGRLTNLQQGVEVLHEASSLPREGHESKTSRTYVDRLIEWIELHRDVPFFAFLHIFDPHSPFEPYHPYDNLWLSPQEIAQHRKDMEKAKKYIEEDFFKRQALANPAELKEAGIDQARYLADEKAWYDSSIRAMDVEIGRLVERLQDLHLAHDTAIAFASDHGEEFLEHGRPFHGYTTYGEMLNVPLILSWPGALPKGVVVKQTVENLDLMPTLLDLSELPLPKEAQGQSLLPLLAQEDPSKLGWTARPAFAERHLAPVAMGEDKNPTESWAMVDGDWKLIRNGIRPRGRPEFELYDHGKDPLNLHDVAAEHPEIVKRMAAKLEAWHEKALAAKVKPDEGSAEISPEEREKLRALGYLQ